MTVVSRAILQRHLSKLAYDSIDNLMYTTLSIVCDNKISWHSHSQVAHKLPVFVDHVQRRPLCFDSLGHLIATDRLPACVLPYTRKRLLMSQEINNDIKCNIVIINAIYIIKYTTAEK